MLCYRAFISSKSLVMGMLNAYCLPASAAAAATKTHLIDVLQFVDDLIYDRVRSFHFDFRIYRLGLNPIAHHTESIAAGIHRKREREKNECQRDSDRGTQSERATQRTKKKEQTSFLFIYFF